MIYVAPLSPPDMEATGLVVAPPAIFKTEKRAESVEVPPRRKSSVPAYLGLIVPLVVDTSHLERMSLVLHPTILEAVVNALQLAKSERISLPVPESIFISPVSDPPIVNV